MASTKIPRYRFQKSRKTGVVRIKKRDYYLKKYGSPESLEEYKALIVEHYGDELTDVTHPLALPLFSVLYQAFCELRYSKDNCAAHKRTIVGFSSIFPDLSTRDIKCRHLEEFQLELCKRKIVSNTVNDYMARLKKIFVWGVRQEHMRQSVLGFFDLIDRVDESWSGIQRTEKVKPLPDELIDPILADVPKTVADLIRFQLLTACRPSEARLLRFCEIQISDGVWLYTPAQHKTSHRGKTRVIPIGPRAQQIIEPHQGRDPNSYVFHSGDPAYPYKKDSYSRSIRRACERLGFEEHWTPNQLRHTAATRIRNEFGIETAQVILGHSHLRTTEIYAAKNLGLAEKFARKFG